MTYSMLLETIKLPNAQVKLFLFDYASDECAHAIKIITCLSGNEFKSLAKVFEKAYKHEQVPNPLPPTPNKAKRLKN
ncbi:MULTISPECIES: hypothetical protein [Helicobacter]|uniref:hypothetical protein n=1 Tax=Helicobacter TaxID=209 RepID=UPI001F0B00F0|nr:MULTISPECIES: hypothetical protein [Helicobacter]